MIPMWFLILYAEFYKDASEVFVMHERGDIDCVISALTIINCAYVMRMIFLKSEINAVIEWLCGSFSVSSIGRDNIMDAVRKDSYDFEDIVQYYSALSYHPDVILTRDKKGFSDLNIPVMTPAEFLERSRRQ